MNYFVAAYILLLSCVGHIFCLNILLVFPVPSKSHYFLGSALGKGLAKAGHEVTMIAGFEDKNPPKNYKEIVLSEVGFRNDKREKFNAFDMAKMPTVASMFFMSYAGNLMTNMFFENAKTQKLLSSDEHFDVVIIEQFLNDAAKILAYHFNAHLVLFSTVGANSWINNLVANPAPRSYVPDVRLGFTSNMNFYQRFYNFCFGLLVDLELYWSFYPQQNALLKKYYPNAPDLDEVQNNVSLVLLNSHESINHPVPHVPNMIDIGGFHVNLPKELPTDLKKFMDSAKEGVIYFSMGSNLLPSQMPKATTDAILKVLGSRKEKILWKWDEDTLENKPDNMMISKFFPQQAILAHPNCKLFITHGGLLSTTETVYLGVPILAIPVFGDQELNAARAVSLGYGKSLALTEINENNFAETLNELLENPSYRENVKIRSKIMHDRPIKPMDLAIYWIEYVVRHNGAPHLRVAGINLPLYKYYMLDVIGLALAGLVLAMCLLSKVCKYIFSKMCGSRETKSELKSKRKRE